MKSPLGIACLALVLIGLAFAPLLRSQTEDIEIMGDSVSGGKTEVLLMQKSTGNGRWVQVGQTFANNTVTAYDKTSGRLTLTKDNKTHILTLKKSTIQAAEATPPSAPITPVTPEQKKTMINNLRQLSAAADQYFLENGVDKVDAAKLVGKEPDKYIKELKPVAGESYSGFVIEQGKPIRIKTAGGVELNYMP
ncbi:MAG: hypothetical protein WC205_07590 [Opitutaceae bacterium]|jgi:hypothetical protein